MSTDLFDGISRKELMAELGCQMRAISEEATCCAWDYRAAELLSVLCYVIVKHGVAGDYQGTPVSLPLARWLVGMAEHLGHWVELGEGAEFQPYARKR